MRSCIFAVALCMLASCAGARTRPTPQASSGATVRRAFFALSVSDLDRVATWYVDNLGFREILRNTPADGPKAALLERDGGLLELIEFATAKPRATYGLPEVDPHDVHGILKIGFEVDDVAGLFETAKQRGLRIFFPLVKPERSTRRTFGLLDPDGNIVQFFGS